MRTKKVFRRTEIRVETEHFVVTGLGKLINHDSRLFNQSDDAKGELFHEKPHETTNSGSGTVDTVNVGHPGPSTQSK
jgi:hypothetical protein